MNHCRIIAVFALCSIVGGSTTGIRSFCKFISNIPNCFRQPRISPNREPTRLPFPASNADAFGTYASPYWSNFDLRGYHRLGPNGMHLLYARESVPFYVALKIELEELVGSTSDRTARALIADKQPVQISFEFATSHVTWESKTFDISSSYSLKYVTSMPFRGVDPYLIDAYFVNLLEGSGISYSMVYFSGSVKLALRGPKVAQIASQFENYGKPFLLRYVVTERIGPSLSDFVRDSFESNMPILKVLKIGVHWFRLIKSLHERNIVHGSVGLESVAFRSRESLDDFLDSDETMTTPLNPFYLTNFEKAVVFQTDEMVRENWKVARLDRRHLETSGGISSILSDDGGDDSEDENSNRECKFPNSPWSSLGLSAYSFRDDAYGVLLSLGRLLYGPMYFEALDKSCRYDWRKYKQIMLSENIFDMVVPVTVLVRPEGRDQTSARTPHSTRTEFVEFHIGKFIRSSRSDVIPAVRMCLQHALRLVRQTNALSVPDYDNIIGYLTAAVEALEQDQDEH